MHGPLLTTLSTSESQIDPLLPGLFSSAVESHAIPEKLYKPWLRELHLLVAKQAGALRNTKQLVALCTE